MRFTETPIAQSFLVDLQPHVDSRGFFARAFCQQELSHRGLMDQCVQANLSHNVRRGTLRGMHFQLPPYAETKLVRAIRGAVQDVILDLRSDSRTYGRWFATELSADNRRALLIPQGCAHGYLTLTDDTEVFYLVSTAYHPEASRGVRWNCEALRGAWPFEPHFISPQDEQWPEHWPGIVLPAPPLPMRSAS